MSKLYWKDYLLHRVYLCVKFFKFKKDKGEPKYKTMKMLEEFVGEDGVGMNLIILPR
jgi:hypothetical protein